MTKLNLVSIFKAAKVAALLAPMALFSCGKLSYSYTKTNSTDFAKSQVITNGPAVADGSSQLLVVIQLMNSDNSVVVDYQPTLEITSGSGVTASPCTKSNANGVSTCVLKSVLAGTKRLAVTNISIVLQADAVFSQPSTDRLRVGLAAAGGLRSSGAAKLSASLSFNEAGAANKNGSAVLYGGVMGEVTSK